jgi:hypothetical protein
MYQGPAAGASRVDSALRRACNDRQGWSSEPRGTCRVVCRSLGRMTALKIVQDHDGLHHSADGGSGMKSVAVRNRWVLAATCVLVALGLLLCAERASLAQEPADPATPQPSVGQGPESAPVALSRPAAPRAEQPVRSEPANGGPALRPAGRPAPPRPAEPAAVPRADPRPLVPRPASHPPAEHGAPDGRGKPAVPPGRQVSSLHKPAHVPREHPQGSPRGSQKPVGQDPVRPRPERPVDRGPTSHPGQQPTPKPRPERPVHEPRGTQGNLLGNDQGGPRGGEEKGRPEGTGSHGQQGVPDNLPGKENTPTPRIGGAVAPGQPEAHPGQDTTAEQAPDNGGGGSRGGTGYEGAAANALAGGPPSGTGTAQHPDRQAASAALPGHESGSGSHSTEEPSRHPAKAASDTPATHPSAARGDSSPLPDQKGAGHSRAVEAASPTAPAGGVKPPYGVRAASDAPLGSTQYFFGYLWDGSSFSVQRDRDGLGLVREGARGFVAATSHGGALTQRAPPLPIPSPFSGFGLTMGGAVFSASSSGDGYAPLLAVIFCCLSAVLWRRRARAYGALLRAGTVPRLALERPG